MRNGRCASVLAPKDCFLTQRDKEDAVALHRGNEVETPFLLMARTMLQNPLLRQRGSDEDVLRVLFACLHLCRTYSRRLAIR